MIKPRCDEELQRGLFGRMKPMIVPFFKYELKDPIVPSAKPDPDPKFLEAYRNSSVKEIDGDLLLRRTRRFLR
jgi:hypothetical protein